jgi:HK97 family phage portal protein
MKLLGLEITKERITERAISVEVTDISPERKTLSYDKVFLEGYPMNMFFKQVTRPYENIASVYKAIKALCDNVPQAKLEIFNKVTEEEVDDPVLEQLLKNPNPRQSQSDFIQEWVGYYALNGEGFIKKLLSVGQVVGTTKLPAQIINLDPSKIKEVIDYSIGQLTGWRFGTMVMTPEEIIHTKDFNPYNAFRGLSPLKPISDEIEIDESTLKFNNAFFRNNATTGLILGTDNNLGEDQRKQLKEALRTRNTGVLKSFSSLILEKGVKPLDSGQHTHKEMEFIEQKKLMREEILGIWRVPKALFNITEDLNYATFMGQMRIFWIYALMPIMRKFEDSINKYIITPYNPNLYVTFDYRNIPAFQEDFKERVLTAQILSQLLFTSNEINEKLELGFDKVPYRDVAYQPFSMQVVTGEPAPAKPAEGTPPAEQLLAGEAPKGAKMDVMFETKKAQFLKMFLKGQGAVEDRMERKMSRYFMELRATMLKIPDNDLKNMQLGILWHEQDTKLKSAMQPITLEGIKTGVAIGESVLGRKKTLDDQDFEHRVNSYLQVRMDKLTGINNTIKDRVEDNLRTTLTEQIQAGASLVEQVMAMRGAIRDFFNLSASRARLIARTESAGAVNGGSMLYYDNEGVAKKQWITAHDELVRPTHRACEEEGAIGMDRAFINGLQYPSDQANGDAGEVCNCRCSLLPIVE